MLGRVMSAALPPPRLQPRDRVRGRAGLPPAARPVVRAVTSALFDLAAGADVEARLVWLLRELDDFLRHAGPRARAIFLASLWAIEWTAPLLAGRRPPFSRLDRAGRLAALHAMERHAPTSLALFGAKATLSILWFEHPRTARESGFDGRCQDGSERLP